MSHFTSLMPMPTKKEHYKLSEPTQIICDAIMIWRKAFGTNPWMTCNPVKRFNLFPK